MEKTRICRSLADSIPSADRWKTSGFAVIRAHQGGFGQNKSHRQNPITKNCRLAPGCGGSCSAVVAHQASFLVL